MIINELKTYYEILVNDEGVEIPLYGYSMAKVGYALNISLEGELLDVISLKIESGKGKKLIPRMLTVPEQKLRSSGISPNFMCDNSTYILGIDNKGKPKRSKKAFEAFKNMHEDMLINSTCNSAKAVLAFLKCWNVENANVHPALGSNLKEILEGSNLVFRLDGETGFLHNDIEIKNIWEKNNVSAEVNTKYQCLITGEVTEIAKLHPVIKNVRHAQSSGASIVSFNANVYESYNKSNGYIAPIGKYSAFAYTTVLNHMLSSNKQKIQVGDATTVFWAESPDSIYTDLAAELFNPSFAKDDEKENKNTIRRDVEIETLIKNILEQTKKGSKINDLTEKINIQTKFYILGLSPNASRISIRFFHKDSFGDFVKKTSEHYKDMEIVKDFKDKPDNIPIWMILKETVSPKSNSQEVMPLLAGSFMRSVISGTPYPKSLYNAIINRVRLDIDSKENNKNIQKINYIRTSIIKAYLVRNARFRKNKKLEEVLTVSLNEKSTNIEYLLGRLFAILEKSQQDANPGLNSTIKDRYFASACSTPATVFPILLRLAQHHIAKSEYGVSIEKRIEPVMNEINKFPAHLTLEQQGTFIIGYYHQRVALYKKIEKIKLEESK